MRFKLICEFLLLAVSYAKAYSSTTIPVVSLSPLLPVERHGNGVIISVVSATFGFSRNQLQPRFGDSTEVSPSPTTKSSDRISFMEQSEDSSDLKERFETISEYLRKKEAYDAAYPNQPSPQDPYLTDSAKVKENQNSQVYRQGDYNNQEIPGNSQMNQEKKENYDKSRIPSDEHYKNSQLYGSSYSSSKQPVSQVNQAVKPATANERNQNEDYYKNVQNYVNAYIDPKTPQSQDSTKDVGVQVDNGQKSQQNSTSASPQYSYIKQVTSEPYVRVQSDYKNPQAYSNLATQSPQLNEGYRAGYQSGNQSTMLLHYPDHNPVLLPHQKITINIEYPTENYNNNVYTTRAPLKRPTKISHTTTKNPNESFRP